MTIGNSYTLTGRTKTSDAEAREHQPTLFAKRVTDIPSDLRIEVDYDVRTDDKPVYIGYAPKGLADGTNGWLIHKIAYDVSNRFSSRKIAYGNWTAHTGYTYE